MEFQSPGESLRQQLSGQLETVAKETPEWSYDRLENVLLLCAASREYIPARFRPEVIHLGKFVRHIDQLRALSRAQGGIEYSRTFFVDLEKRALLQGRTEKGNDHSVAMNFRKQPGREYLQTGSAGLHIHPTGPGEVIIPLSGPDFSNFIHHPEQVLDLVSMEKHTLVVVKTSVTPRNPSAKMIQELTHGIADEYRKKNPDGTHIWNSLSDAIKANKHISLSLGLMYYIAGPDGIAKRQPLVT